jgi:hypothetical protein
VFIHGGGGWGAAGVGAGGTVVGGTAAGGAAAGGGAAVGVCASIAVVVTIAAARAASPRILPIKSAPDKQIGAEECWHVPRLSSPRDTIWSQLDGSLFAEAYRREGLMGLERLKRSIAVAGLAILAGLSLSGCLDLVQTVGIDRAGAGRYQIAASAEGFVGEALKNEKLVNKQNHATWTTVAFEGKTTRTATVDFKSLSDLAFSDEAMRLNVKGRDFFGLGPSHVAFVTDVMVDKAKHDNPRAQPANNVGEEVAQSILGDHTYSFTVTVPGSVERAVPVTLGNHTYEPVVSGDYFSHTVTWKIPLYALVNSQALAFEVDFWAWGTFSDTKSQLVAND